MGTIDELRARTSVRAFLPEPIGEQERLAVLEAATQAPTAGNQQLYSIIDVRDAAVKERLSHLCDEQPFIAKAPMVLLFAADCAKWPAAYREAGVSGLREPGVGDLFLACADALIAAQNAVCAAWSLGIGSCYIGDVMERCEDLRALLALPEHVFPAALVVFGRPTPQQAARTKPARAPLDAIVMTDRYEPLSGDDLRAMLAGRTNNLGFDEWVRAFCARKYESDFSREMTRSVGVYLKSFER